MCFEIPSVHHDIHRLEGREIGTFFENVAEDLLPEGLPCLSICLIRQGCVSLKPCRWVTNHETRQGIEAPSSKSVSWQRFIHNFITPLCMGEPDGRRCDWGLCREPDFIRPTHTRSFINFHGQGISTRFHIIWFRFSVSWTDTDSSNSILRKRGRHVHGHQKTPPAKDYNVLSGKLQVRKRWLRLVPAKDYNALSGLTRSNQKTPQRATTPCWHLEPKQGFHNIGQEQGHTSVASDETSNFHIKAN